MFGLAKPTSLLLLLASLASTASIPTPNIQGLPIGNCIPQITTLSRSPNKLQNFVGGTDGKVYTQFWDAGYITFNEWRPLEGITVPPCSIVGGVSRSDGWLDIYVTADDGKVYTSYKLDDGWSAWRWIEGGFAKPGSPVTAISRKTGLLDIFVVGTDESVWQASWEEGRSLGDYRGWWKVGLGVLNAQVALGSPIEAVARNADNIDVFVVAKNSRLYTANWSDGAWGAFILHQATMYPGTPITAVAKSADTVEIYVVLTDNCIYTSAWTAATGWKPLVRLLNPVYLAPKSRVGAVLKGTSDDLLYTFVGNDQNIYTGSWTAKVGWVNPTPMNKGKAFAGTTVSATSRKKGVVDLFTFSLDAWSWGAHWESGNEGWCGWWQTTFRGPACFSSAAHWGL